MSARFDVLGLGCVAIDDLLYVPTYPAADSKMRVRRRQRQCGGLTATALVAAARHGARCAYAGTLGDDELSRFVLDRFAEEGIDTSLIRRRQGTRPIHSLVIVDESHGTRTILFDLEGACGAEVDWPAEEVIRSARVLFVDHFGVEGMARAAQIARAAGIPVVADLESDEHPKFADLLALVDHLIVSGEFAARLTGQSDPARAAQALWTPARRVVVVTCGAQGCWYYAAAEGAARHQSAFPVDVVDTTGCGDVFHGVYAAGLAQRLPLDERVRRAAAAAALKATRCGGQAGIPTRAEVDAMLATVQDATFKGQNPEFAS